MLGLLHIENIAVIERADIQLQSGLTVLTGETGAGKSILIDAIGALLGQRTSRELVRAGAPFGLVSATFSDLSEELCALLAEMDLQGDDSTELLVQRRLSAEGKNVCRVNLKPASTAVLRVLAPYLINVHGQHDGAKLLEEDCHITFLDAFANLQPILAQYQPMYAQLRRLKREITALDQNEQQRLQRVEQLTAQLAEIDAIALQIGEQEQLTTRKVQFDHAERLATALDRATYLLDDAEAGGACTALSGVTTALQSLADLSPAWAKMGERAHEVQVLADELRLEVAEAQARVEFSPTEHAAIEERLDVIYRICQKYNTNPRGVLDAAVSMRAELEQLENGDTTRQTLRESYRQLLAQARQTAGELSQARQQAAMVLQERIVTELAQLDMARVRFSVAVQTGNKLGSIGMDTVQFLISVNPGEALKPLAKVASGGELSRVMLAMKNVLTAQEAVGTLIFDEIDTGVSGRAAQRIAHKLSQIGAQKQTLCVTHLPQIAAMGDHHLLIAKDTAGERTFTSVTPLTGEARAQELARMLAGDHITQAALENARNLLELAVQAK